MILTGEIIDDKYQVEDVCSDSGGMGTLLFVTPTTEQIDHRIVLKYCREENEEWVRRFRREVRLLKTFEGNSKVIQIIDSNLEYDPPYFVMKYYERGDLSNISDEIRADYGEQERIFIEILSCISELHARDNFHRDIKPQNFLITDNGIIVSDFGLSMEVGSDTGFTTSSQFWGTHGYLPPEFLHGGFKHADASGDIFMIGKTMYALITGRDPNYLVDDGVPAPILHIIERCCALDKNRRYQSLAELKEALTAAYDVMLGRTGGLGETRQLLASISDRLEREHKYRSEEVNQFIEKLNLLETPDKVRICFELPPALFDVLKQEPVIGQLESFLSAYEEMVESEGYGWSFAETIAHNMRKIFQGDEVPIDLKARSLELAVDAAYRMNRFAAMDTCRDLIRNIRDEQLGLAVSDVILRVAHPFLTEIEPSQCQSEAIRSVIRRLNS